MKTPPARRQIARRAVAVATGSLVLVASSVALAGPASAGVPEGWATEDEWSLGGLLALLFAIPIIAGLVIALLVLLPGIMRGDGLIPTVEEQPAELSAGGQETRAIQGH